jgi:hypothetical protein
MLSNELNIFQYLENLCAQGKSSDFEKFKALFPQYKSLDVRGYPTLASDYGNNDAIKFFFEDYPTIFAQEKDDVLFRAVNKGYVDCAKYIMGQYHLGGGYLLLKFDTGNIHSKILKEILGADFKLPYYTLEKTKNELQEILLQKSSATTIEQVENARLLYEKLSKIQLKYNSSDEARQTLQGLSSAVLGEYDLDPVHSIWLSRFEQDVSILGKDVYRLDDCE